MSMRKLVSCEFNIDTACVELRYADGEVLSLYTSGVADSTQHKSGLLSPEYPTKLG